MKRLRVSEKGLAAMKSGAVKERLTQHQQLIMELVARVPSIDPENLYEILDELNDQFGGSVEAALSAVRSGAIDLEKIR